MESTGREWQVNGRGEKRKEKGGREEEKESEDARKGAKTLDRVVRLFAHVADGPERRRTGMKCKLYVRRMQEATLGMRARRVVHGRISRGRHGRRVDCLLPIPIAVDARATMLLHPAAAQAAHLHPIRSLHRSKRIRTRTEAQQELRFFRPAAATARRR